MEEELDKLLAMFMKYPMSVDDAVLVLETFGHMKALGMSTQTVTQGLRQIATQYNMSLPHN